MEDDDLLGLDDGREPAPPVAPDAPGACAAGEFATGDGCAPLTACTADQYERTAPTATTAISRAVSIA